MIDADLLKLKEEIETDPLGLGYDADDPHCAELLNEVNGDYSIDREAVDGQELQMAVVINEYAALSDIQRMGWQAIISAGSGIIAVSDARVKAQIAAIWGPGTTTRANLILLQTRSGSRAEVLFGSGVRVSHLDVGMARQVI
jgi:hypothetical protein